VIDKHFVWSWYSAFRFHVFLLAWLVDVIEIYAVL
jgi:hypothetical protein